MDKKKLYLAIFSIVITIGIFWFINSISKVSFEVNTNPTNALFYINDIEYKTPIKIKITAGTYRVWVIKDGYQTYEKDVVLEKYKKNKLDIKLFKDEVDEPVEGAPVDYKEITLDSLNNLPKESENFIITWKNAERKILITPNIEMSVKDVPTEVIAGNWDKYNQMGKEALGWLEDNGLGAVVREKNGIGIEWWAEEYWPEGKKISL